jgi:hypothetical protein
VGLSAGTDAEGNALLTVNNDLAVLGDTTLSDVTIIGNLMAGLVKIDSLENSIDVLGTACYNPETGLLDSEACTSQTLFLQKSLAGNIDLFNGIVTVSPDGLLNVNGEIRAEKYAVSSKSASKASAGKATIVAGQTTIEINTEALTENSLIFVTPNEPVLLGSKKTNTYSFEISMETAKDTDIEVSWWIVDNVETLPTVPELPVTDQTDDTIPTDGTTDTTPLPILDGSGDTIL